VDDSGSRALDLLMEEAARCQACQFGEAVYVALDVEINRSPGPGY